MAITKTWQVNTMERDLSDGHVNKVIYRVIGKDGDTEKDRATGEVTFTKPESLPSGFIAYDTSKKTPDSATMITWVKDALGTEAVTNLEADLKAEIDLINTPVQATGVAF